MTKVRLILLSLLLLALAGCKRDGLDLTLDVGPYGDPPEETRKVMLLYEAGFNSLTNFIAKNISSLKKGYLPGNERNDDVVLVFSHLSKSRSDFASETAPSMIRLYSQLGEVQSDTLKVWPAGTPIANAEMVAEVFNWVKENFPAAGYGAVLSSHGFGWLPAGYYIDAKKYEGADRKKYWSMGSPRFRSFGQDYYSNGSVEEEIEIRDLANAIPYHLEYIMFDACFMAAVEVAWELKDVCDLLIASPCEVPGDGFDYSSLTERLLKPDVPDALGVCDDFFTLYEKSIYGAAISLVDCRALEELAGTCKTLFEKYRSAIRNLDGNQVKHFDREANHSWCAFFDLKDMMREAGATDEELASLQLAIDKALLYEKHTKEFLSVDLENTCGLSVYLPSYPDYRADLMHGTAYLDSFYKSNLSWNQATGLVE